MATVRVIVVVLSALQDFLPARIINRFKHGFDPPFGEWLKTSPALQDLIYAKLRLLKNRGGIRADYIDGLISHRDEHTACHGAMVWLLAMLEEWLQTHLESV